MRNSKRRVFLARMFREAMVPYAHLVEEWTDDESEFLPIFMQILGRNNLILDLAGGYERVTPYLLKNENGVVVYLPLVGSLKYFVKVVTCQFPIFLQSKSWPI